MIPRFKVLPSPAAVAFSRRLVRGALAVAVLVLCNCHPTLNPISAYDGIVERRAGVPLESEWNAVGLWQRVGNDPATYIPKGYPAASPRGSNDGAWFDDKRDGKRLFVPNAGVEGVPCNALQGEARKVTNWRIR